MNTTKIFLASLSFALMTGCAGTEEYEITGEVSSAQTVSGAISLEFFEIDPADEEAERVSVHTAQLDALGAFAETVEVSADTNIIVLALVDSDGDGACSDGELWAEQTLEPSDDAVPAAELALSAAACPASAPAE